ncbi:hypothetical protein SAY86_019750 [Trapa natans]|uniref:Uncharacterized protein n=1 Tax=Trapa natans TaxID=22666 RepID=A0AAN7R5V1_TRANT|nr:hypothetical protein SAY86_019750 [Trapa natans]
MIIDKFGISAIKIAWNHKKQVTDHILQSYTRPLRNKGWDRALVEYTAAMLLDVDSELRPPIQKRLHENSCPGLFRLGMLRDSPRQFQDQLLKNCGHLPHEEKVDEFVNVVRKFLQRNFGGYGEQMVQQALA